MKTQKFYVNGIHCNACKILIEDIVTEEKNIHRATVSLSEESLIIEGDFGDAEMIAENLTKLLEPHKYSLSLEKQQQQKDLKSLTYAIPLGLFILALFFLLQRSGIINFGFKGGLSLWTTLLIGVIASLSTCLAVVGSLVLSLSAKISQKVSTIRPFLFFHAGRLFGFAALGALLGEIGSTIAINNTFISTFGIITALIIIILGINLLDIFHITKSLQLALPRGIFDRLTKIENGFFAPFIIGAATFFLPCGFTQSMQLAALSSGSFLSGGLIMFTFAVGTLPVLSALSFTSFHFAHTKYAPLFFKTAGIVVIGLGIFVLLAGFAGLGIIKPIFNI